MANAYSINFSLASSTNGFSAIWKMTRVMKAAGWTVVGVSNGTNIRTQSGTSSSADLDGGTPTASNANDYWGSNADPLTDTYNTGMNTVPQWIVMKGPSTIKLSFTTAPGNLLRGESVTQATSGATGELLGLVWDSSGSTGWAVIMPRTGTFDNSNVVTGDVSLETFTPTAYVEYKREVMIHKTSNEYTGSIYYICADTSGEATQFFSKLAEASGCTKAIGPAMGGTGNLFPSNAMVVFGTAGGTAGTTLFGASTSYNSFGQTACVNATPGSGISADGSFYCVIPIVTNIRTIMFIRCDNTEPGDVDPYVWYNPTANLTHSSYTNNTTVTNSNQNVNWSNLINASNGSFCGYIGRGTGTARDKAVSFAANYSYFGISYFYSGVNARGHSFPQATVSTPLIKEPTFLISPRTTEVWYKGSPRWIYYGSLGNLYDTYDSKQYMVILARSSPSNPAVIIGPMDGSTTPIPS